MSSSPRLHLKTTTKTAMRQSEVAFALSPVLRLGAHSTFVTRHSQRHAFRNRGWRRLPRTSATIAACAQSELRVRRATVEDIPLATRILSKAFCEDALEQLGYTFIGRLAGARLMPLYELVTRMELSMQLRRRVGNSKHAILLAEMGENTVGCAEVGVLDIKQLTKGGNEVKQWGQGGREAYVGNVGVVPCWRFKGIGRRLLEASMGEAEEWGIGNVWLCVEARNGGAVKFYERLGFGCVAQEPTWFDEVGKRRRLFLCSGRGMEAGEWEKAKVVGGKLGVMEYLRYCLWDLRRRGREEEAK